MCFWRRKKKKAEKPVVESKKEVKEQKVEKEVEVKPQTEATEKPEVKPVETEEKKEVKDIYHITLNNDKKSKYFKMWRVRKANSTKTIKYFETQLEAIKFAEDLAEKNDGSIVIHKMDGSIRKQDYSK